MTNAELNQRVRDKCSEELKDYIAKINQAYLDGADDECEFKTGESFMNEYADMFAVYRDIMYVVESKEFSNERCKLLLDCPYLLWTIFQKWLENGVGYMDGLRWSVESIERWW